MMALSMAENETRTGATSHLFNMALHMGDNCLILGHRISQWAGHAPILEEDIAIANMALDLIGQAQLWLELAGEVEGAGRSADELAYLRDAEAFRNLLLVELPNGDYGDTLMRQFLFDTWHYHILQDLAGANERRIAQIASKALKEVAYHMERSGDLVIGLGDGTRESHERMQTAVDRLWMYTGEMFEGDDSRGEQGEVEAGLYTSPIKSAWDSHINSVFERATLTRPDDDYMQSGGRRGVHTEHLGYILSDMQFLQRAYPGAAW